MYWFVYFILFSGSLAHSWNEQLTVITDGVYTGRNGYCRGYVPRTSPGFTDNLMAYLLPPLASGRTRIDNTDILCPPTQRTMNQTEAYPWLQVLPGSYVAIKYLENGHVTLPQNQPGKPPGSGTVHVFGTTEPGTNEILTEVLKWTQDGTGGNKRGRLLTAHQNFDDDRCYQINDGALSHSRQQSFPNYTPDNIMHEQWCETNIQIPSDLQPKKIYIKYWVWKWPTSAGVPGLPDGKDEFYTSCSDLEIIEGPLREGPANPLPGQDPQKNAVARFKERAAKVSGG